MILRQAAAGPLFLFERPVGGRRLLAKSSARRVSGNHKILSPRGRGGVLGWQGWGSSQRRSLHTEPRSFSLLPHNRAGLRTAPAIPQGGGGEAFRVLRWLTDETAWTLWIRVPGRDGQVDVSCCLTLVPVRPRYGREIRIWVGDHCV